MYIMKNKYVVTFIIATMSATQTMPCPAYFLLTVPTVIWVFLEGFWWVLMGALQSLPSSEDLLFRCLKSTA